MKNFIYLLIPGILLLAHPSFGQNTIATTSSTQLAGVGIGSFNVMVEPLNIYPDADNANYNVFVGANAGRPITTGDHNAFTGYNAGRFNTSGAGNTFMGSNAGYTNTSGGFNTFVGQEVGYGNTTGYENSMIGLSAGYLNSTGHSNSFVGAYAGLFNTSGAFNTYIGHESDGTGSSGSTLQRATAIGYQSKVGVSDGLVLGNNDIKVGIGTAYPNQRLTIRGNMNFVAYDNSLQLKNQPFLHFNEHESLALGLGAEIPSGAEKTLVLGSEASEVQIPGVAKDYRPNTGQFLTVNEAGNMALAQPHVQVASVADWSDKVFEPGYALRPLGEVEEFVKKNKHLPGIPSAEKMVAEGMESAAFNAKLLEKIEELTLYVVELEKRLKELEKK